MRIDIRWAADAVEIRRHAAELVALAPDIILASGSPTLAALQQATRTVPIVFVNVVDPVGSRLRRQPGAAGRQHHRLLAVRIQSEREMAGAAQADRAKRDASGRLSRYQQPSGIAQFGAIQAVAPSLGMEVSPIRVRDAGEIERAVAAFARAAERRSDRDGERVRQLVHRNLIVALAARHKLPAVYYRTLFVTAGGLISYGPDFPTSIGTRGRLR